MSKENVELTVFAQAWRETLEQFPGIVVSRQVHWANEIRWLMIEDDGRISPSCELKMTVSQASGIKNGRQDTRTRTMEGLLLALILHSMRTGEQAFEFCMERMSELLRQRAEDHLCKTISPQRYDALSGDSSPELITSGDLRRAEQALRALVPTRTTVTIGDLLRDEFIARGLQSDLADHRQRFVDSARALGIGLSIKDVEDILAGKPVSDVVLGRLQNVIPKDRFSGDRYSFEELLRIRNDSAELELNAR